MDLEGISQSDRLTLLGLLLSFLGEGCLIKDGCSLDLDSRNLVLSGNLHKHRLERELIEKQGTARLGIELESTVHHRTFLTESSLRCIAVLIHYLRPVILIFSGTHGLEHKNLDTRQRLILHRAYDLTHHKDFILSHKTHHGDHNGNKNSKYPFHPTASFIL